MDGVLIHNSTVQKLRASDILTSYSPPAGVLTYYYWDDWALSGLLKPGGHTLTLGIAGGSGPRRLAVTDKTHWQTGVDLNVSRLPSHNLGLRAVSDDAFHFIQKASENFDTIWVDLYDNHGLVPSVLERQFIVDLSRRLKPGGFCFIHLFRPENRFYRYARIHDPFEPLFSRLLVDLGFEAAVFDHYASQTWVLSDFFAESLRRQLIHIGITRMEPIDHWLNSYMLRILRKPLIADGMPDISQSLLWKAFRAPVDVAALTDVKLSTVSGVQDLDSWSETPKKLIPNNTELSNGNRLLWETMAMWLTAPGLRLPQPCREYLLSVALRYPETQADEFELRRPLLVTDN